MNATTQAPEISLVPLKQALVDSDSLQLQVLARIRAAEDTALPRTPLSIALVIDRSGSMHGPRLEAAKEGARRFISQLHDDDEVCIVAYDDSVSVPLALMPVRAARPLLSTTLSRIDDGGTTDLHSGWLEGARQLAPRTGQNRLCRVLLLSDGQANRGIVNIDVICEQVSQMASAGVSTSTVGIGMGFNERLMTAMALAGQGTAMYGDRAEDLIEPFEAEIGLLGALAWRDVTLKLKSSSRRWKLHNDYPLLEPGIWRLPAIAAGTEAWVALSLTMDRAVRAQLESPNGSALTISLRAVDADGNAHRFLATLPVLPKVSEAEYDALPADELVRRRFGEVEAADLQREARKAASERNWSKVARMLDELQDRARDNPWLLQTVSVLRDLLEQRDQVRLEKELMYSSHSLKNRLTESDETVFFSMSMESEKPAFLRRKTQQGRRSDSQ